MEPWCSAMQLRRIGLSHSLHLTKPMSDKEVRGLQAKIFMSRAVSHAVGGEASDASSFVESDGEGLSHEKGEGEWLRDLRRSEDMRDGDCSEQTASSGH